MNTSLDKLIAIARAWPGTDCTPSGTHATFRVKGKVFAYFLDDHHGDGIVSVGARTELGENEELARREPKRFYLPAHIGKRGWVGLRLDVGRVKWTEVASLMEQSYRLATRSGSGRRRSASSTRTASRKSGPASGSLR